MLRTAKVKKRRLPVLCVERVWGGIGGEEWGGDGKDREGMGRGGEGGSILAPPCPPLPVISDPLPPKSSVFSLT